MTVLGLSSKREITRTSIRVRTAMAAQARDQGRYLGGRPRSPQVPESRLTTERTFRGRMTVLS
jgi:hypothetical protein